MKEKIQKFREYLDYIERHYDNVQKAWNLIYNKCYDGGFKFMSDPVMLEIINKDVINHDLSKLSEEEFTQYRQNFFPIDGELKDKSKFNSAWDHHRENNLHHWQNWTEKCDGHNWYWETILITNIIDWVAMGFEFNNTAKEYYEKNKDIITLPKWAIKIMYKIFDKIYPENNEVEKDKYK